jgi:hypothetical protein
VTIMVATAKLQEALLNVLLVEFQTQTVKLKVPTTYALIALLHKEFVRPQYVQLQVQKRVNAQ